jgi:hypothetical protein
MSYFTKEINPANGLIYDKTQPGSASSIAVVGLGLSSYVVGVEKGLLTREEAIKKTLTILHFFYEGKQSEETDAMGYKGFYYHFLDMDTGARVNECELSTIDTALFIAGALTAAGYFTKKTRDENQIRLLADKLYKRIDWQWALNKTGNICHGWKPENGFLEAYWNTDYSEAMILYIFALGSATFPIPKESYENWISTFKLKTIYHIKFLYAGPLFIHQLSHIWIDFRGIKDDFNRKAKFDYFENSGRATRIQQKYAIENKNAFAYYGKKCWGVTASSGPGPATIKIDGVVRTFYNYKARGVPYGPDDGTVSPWAVIASLPFAPAIVLDSIKYSIGKLGLKKNQYGFVSSFNPTFPDKQKNSNGWVSPWIYGLNQGPVILMIENYSSGLIWTIMKKCPVVIRGLKRAGFQGGWLVKKKARTK